MTLKKEFFVERSGQQFVLYAGLLDEAHQQELQSITTSLLQIPSDENKQIAICQAIVVMKDGRSFSGIGDASPANVARPMATAIIRMSETRAKARALRDAVNVGAAALEELDSGFDQQEMPVNTQKATARPPVPRPTTTTFKPTATKPVVTKESLIPRFIELYALMENIAPSYDKVLNNPDETVESLQEYILETEAYLKNNPQEKAFLQTKQATKVEVLLPGEIPF